MKSVVICGSQRYKDEISNLVCALKELGAPAVFEPNFEEQSNDFVKKEEKERLQDEKYRGQVPAMVHAHFERIRKADICYIYNKKGYLGVNTTLELGYAHGKGMIIYALEPEQPYSVGGESCRDILFSDIIKTPEELLAKLQ